MFAGSRTACALLFLTFGMGGCITYAATEVSAMSSYDICETQLGQGVNLTAESQRLLRRELERRSENCRAHLTAIQAQRDEDLYERMYQNQSP